MRCRSCNAELTDDEAIAKYDDWENIPNVNDRYIELCSHCLRESDLSHHAEDDYAEVQIDEDDDISQDFSTVYE